MKLLVKTTTSIMTLVAMLMLLNQGVEAAQKTIPVSVRNDTLRPVAVFNFSSAIYPSEGMVGDSIITAYARNSASGTNTLYTPTPSSPFDSPIVAVGNFYDIAGRLVSPGFLCQTSYAPHLQNVNAIEIVVQDNGCIIWVF